MMAEKLKQLIEISRYYGKNPEYIIAGGGNTSFKNEEKLWIKASGSSMADIEEDGFVCLSIEALKKISSKNYSQDSTEREAQIKTDLHNAILYPENKRPSVETSLHEVIDFPFVVHTHPTLVNALMCSKNAQQLTADLFGYLALYVEYTDPGFILFKKVEAEIIRYRKKHSTDPSVIFLQNHGVFVGGNSVEEIMSVYAEIEKVLRIKLVQKLPVMQEIAFEAPEETIARTIRNALNIDHASVLFCNSELIQKFVANRTAFDKVNKPFTPDDIVYCKSKYLFVSDDLSDIFEQIKSFESVNGYFPKVIAVEGKGLIAIEENIKSAQTVLEVFQNMMKVSFYSENFGGPQFMTQNQIDFIDNWEVENYRRQVAKKQ